jgi:hypothetical protein
VILEALNPGRMQAHASTAEVPRGAARARGGRAATTAPTCRAEFAGPAADSGRLPDAPPARTRICARTARRASTAPVWPAPAFAPVTSAAPARSTATVAAAAPNEPAPSVSACVRCRPTGRPDRPMPPATPASVTSPRPVPGARRSARSSASTLPGRGYAAPAPASRSITGDLLALVLADLLGLSITPGVRSTRYANSDWKTTSPTAARRVGQTRGD